ncbi:adhesion G protein-coupled receptor L4-like [Dysidea avara]|uniref:adhesion G protein-coupled receptor L4-like n=1 Tax=Dysidea avara TaxID=196820 RepID=UPI00332DC93B
MCNCVDGFTGENCSINIDDCDPNPCLNNGTCADGFNSFTCNCVDGFTGENCSTNIDDCDPNPCMNNGTCKDEFNSFTCNCMGGFTGDTCENKFFGCFMEQDSTWNMTWPETLPGVKANQTCQGNGTAHRQCLKNDLWGEPDLSECHTPEITKLEREVESLLSNGTETKSADTVIGITNELSSSLNTTQMIFPNDVNSITNILETVLSVTVELDDEDDNSSLVQEVTEDFTGVLDILFDEENDASFQQIRNEDVAQPTATASERLLATSEQVGRLLSTTLDVSTNETVRTSLVGRRKNIAIEVLIPTEESLMTLESIMLPDTNSSTFGNMTPMFQIPTTVILNQMNKEGRRVPIISTITRNSYLPTDERVRLVSLLLSIQISSDKQPRTSLGNESVSMVFNIGNAGNNSQFDAYCAFFDLSNSINQSGRFSADGVSTDGIIQNNTTNDASVQCSTTHLTSFAVLADSSGENSESEALAIISYIGCAVSIVCLIIAVILLIALRKRVFKLRHHFIHTNLAIALLLGLVVFVSGIETASEYRATCLTVAILLHYFFMAVFSWMLCEGILMFIMIKMVFYDGFFKSRKFFFLVGWGLPIPIVVVSAGVSHEQYGLNDRCWISEEKGAIWAFIGPMLAIILVNIFFLTIAIYEVFKSKYSNMTTEKATKRETVKSLLKAAVLFVPLLGTTWVFGILSVNEDTVVFAWMFTIFNSLQGLFILILHVLKNEKLINLVRRKWTGTSRTDSSIVTSKRFSFPNKAKECKGENNDNRHSSATINSAILQSYQDDVILNEYTQPADDNTPTQVQPLNISNTHIVDVHETKLVSEHNDSKLDSVWECSRHHEESTYL